MVRPVYLLNTNMMVKKYGINQEEKNKEKGCRWNFVGKLVEGSAEIVKVDKRERFAKKIP